ncbi:G-protein-signaling modulator 2-like [Uloborus diversus]|uniref:G-protein-signaling modulator 2-like n=1 Tax=Uloborus diversus TaxID=327109 RepID=UPI00240977AA|nr:G-protein-signaling modulator 2-like [Uloborus diversus]
MVELEDRSAQGRACGNLGNTHYLLGNFNEAVSYHNERLKIAKEYRDLAAERRAHNNLGNAHIFLGEFEVAADHYKKTLSLAIELRDKAVEAQAYYSLGNTYTLLHDYPTAIDYHLRHLKIAQELKDRIGEGRAYWSLGNAHSAIGNHEQALHYANRHLEVSKEIGDTSGEITAQHAILDLQKIMDFQDGGATCSLSNASINSSGRMRRISMEQMDILKLTPDAKVAKSSIDDKEKKLSPVTEKSPKVVDMQDVKLPMQNTPTSAKENKIPVLKETDDLESSLDEDSFFDLLSRFQSKRMDDQRCSLVLSENKENNQLLGNFQNNFQPSSSSSHPNNFQNNFQPSASSHANNNAANVDRDNNRVRDDLFDLIAGMQSRRLDEQRASLPQLPGLNYFSLNNGAPRIHNNNNTIPLEQSLHRPSTDASAMSDDDFFEMLMRCQASRIEDQRSTMPEARSNSRHMYSMTHCNGSNAHAAPTVPDEDFFSLIMRLQAGRIEDQRSALPVKPAKEKASTSSANSSSQGKASGSSSKSSSFRSSLKSVSGKGSLKR